VKHELCIYGYKYKEGGILRSPIITTTVVKKKTIVNCSQLETFIFNVITLPSHNTYHCLRIWWLPDYKMEGKHEDENSFREHIILHLMLKKVDFFSAGTAFWGLINPQWNLCSKGRRQSPINIEPSRLLYDPQLRPIHIDKTSVSHFSSTPCHLSRS